MRIILAAICVATLCGQGMAPGPGVVSYASAGGTVAFDAIMTAGNGGTSSDTMQASAVTTVSGTPITLGSSATCLVVVANLEGSTVLPTSITATWNSVSMTSVGSPAVSSNITAAAFYLTNPTTGSHTLALSWTNSADIYVGAVSFKTTNTSTCVNTGDYTTTVTGTGPHTITVTSGANDATVASYITNGSTPTVNFNLMWADSALNPGGAGNYQLGGTSNGHVFTGGGGTLPTGVGVHVVH